jgi:hypothetical protein
VISWWKALIGGIGMALGLLSVVAGVMALVDFTALALRADSAALTAGAAVWGQLRRCLDSSPPE